MDRERIEYRCSFCNKHQAQAGRLFAGPGGVFICDECVTLSSEIVAEERKADGRTKEPPGARLRFWRR